MRSCHIIPRSKMFLNQREQHLLQMIVPLTTALLAFSLLDLAAGRVTLRLNGRVIPNNGGGSVLITEIGPNNNNALLCLSQQPGCCAGATNWYYRYGDPKQRRVRSNDGVLGWKRNRGRNPGVVRLRTRSDDPHPGQSQEGVYTCEIVGDGLVSVGLYYSLEVQLKFELGNMMMSLSYTITCTSTGGTVLQSSFTGPNRESLMALTAVGTPQRRGFDIYRSTVTRTTGNHGDTYTCTASNGASTSTRNYTISAALAPTNITWEQVTPSVLRIQWIQPQGGAPVRSYTITVIYGNGVIASYVTLKPRNRFVTIQRLVNDGRAYTISIAAMSDHLPGSTSITAYLTQLSPPSLTITDITSTTATLTLSASSAHHTPTPDHYQLTFSRVTGAGQLGGCPTFRHNGTILLKISQLHVTLNDLEEASTYSLTVQALSRVMGNSSLSDPTYFTTTEAAPSQAPRNLGVGVVTASSVRLQWEAISSCLDVNGIPSGWQVRYWETGESPLLNARTLFVPGSPLAAGGTRVMGLPPYTNYSFQVAVVTSSQLVGMYSDPVTAITLETVPGPVTSLAELSQNSTTVCITWQPPYPSNGRITSYSVTHWLPDSDGAIKTSLTSNETVLCTSSPPNAKLGQELIFSLRAHSQMGAGGPVNISIIIGSPSHTDSETEELSSGDDQFLFEEFCFQIQFGPTDQCITWTVSKAPAVQVGWLLARVQPDCLVNIPSLDVAEQPVAMAPTNQTITLPLSSLELVNMCVTELQRMCNSSFITRHR